MTPLILAILLFALGLMFVAAEFFVPAHGTTAGLGLLALIAGVVACFFVNQWVGVGVLAAVATLAPIAMAGWMRVFPHTWLARRVVLPPAQRPNSRTAAALSPVRVGQTGITISALRPSGVCEFQDLRADASPADPLRIEAISDFGQIGPGSRIRVICVAEGRATVRRA